MLIWTNEIPSQVGWYWKRNLDDKYDEPECVHVRNYVGELAIGNSPLRGWEGLNRYEWAGPIPIPNVESVTNSANERLLGQALLNVLVVAGILLPGSQPTGPELIAVAEVYCGKTESRPVGMLPGECMEGAPGWIRYPPHRTDIHNASKDNP